MNATERDQLSHFLQQLTETRINSKDSEAEQLIREAVSQQPDAAYLLVQRSLIQDHALQVAQAKINELQQQTTQSQSNGFLANDPWALGAATRAAGLPAGSLNRSQPPVNAPDSFRNAPQAGPGFASSFLGNIASTAAGVAAGSFLFQGIENLFGHHASGFSQPFLGGQMPEQTVINNYYGDDGINDQTGSSDYLADDDSGNYFDDNDSGSDWV